MQHFFFHQLQQIFLIKYFFQLTFLRLFISIFCISHFAPVTQEKYALQRMMTLYHYYGNNQDSIYELYVVYVEAQRTNHAKLGLYEVYGFRLIVNLLEKYLDLSQVNLLNRDSLQVNKSELGLLWLL